jgi:hypothetical protein
MAGVCHTQPAARVPGVAQRLGHEHPFQGSHLSWPSEPLNCTLYLFLRTRASPLEDADGPEAPSVSGECTARNGLGMRSRSAGSMPCT